MCIRFFECLRLRAARELTEGPQRNAEGAYLCATRSPKELVEKVNRVMWRNTTEAKFITLVYGLLDVECKTLRYANAGHNAPILTRKDGAQVRLQKGGLILGIFEERSYEQDEIELRPGDRLVMFTDGVTEAVDGEGEEFGEERLAEASRCGPQLSAEALRRRLLDHVTEFCGGEFEDDATVVVVAVSERNGDATGCESNASRH